MTSWVRQNAFSIVTLLVTIGGWVWFAAELTAGVEHLRERVTKLEGSTPDETRWMVIENRKDTELLTNELRALRDSQQRTVETLTEIRTDLKLLRADIAKAAGGK